MMVVIFLKTFMTQIHNTFIIFETFEIPTQSNRNVAYGYMKKFTKRTINKRHYSIAILL